MSGRRRLIATLAILAIAPALASGFLEAGLRNAPQASVAPAKPIPPGQEAAVASRPIKEQMAVRVLLAWVWLAIAVLLVLIRLKVREADRVFRMGLDVAAGKKPGSQGH